MAGLELVSANLALNNGNSSERLHNFHESCLELTNPPDVIALQEVNWKFGEVALRALCIDLGPEYNLETCPSYPGKEDEKGIAIISKHPVVDTEHLEFEAGGKSAQLVTIQLKDGETCQIVNIHMEASPLKEIQRVRKVKELLERLSQNSNVAQIVTGDFNAETYFPCIRVLRKLGMSSVFDTLKVRSPHTYPTPLSKDELIGGGYSKPHQFHIMRVLGNLVPGQKSESGLRQSVVDYIFHNGQVRPTSAGAIFHPEYGKAPWSDHRGLMSSLELITND